MYLAAYKAYNTDTICDPDAIWTGYKDYWKTNAKFCTDPVEAKLLVQIAKAIQWVLKRYNNIEVYSQGVWEHVLIAAETYVAHVQPECKFVKGFINPPP